MVLLLLPFLLLSSLHLIWALLPFEFAEKSTTSDLSTSDQQLQDPCCNAASCAPPNIRRATSVDPWMYFMWSDSSENVNVLKDSMSNRTLKRKSFGYWDYHGSAPSHRGSHGAKITRTYMYMKKIWKIRKWKSEKEVHFENRTEKVNLETTPAESCLSGPSEANRRIR